MIDTEKILSSLRSTGVRITKTRRTIIDIFVKKAKPLSVQEILGALLKKKQNVNKTTVYRELDFLEEQDILRQVQLGQDRKRYELTTGPHHHHIRCIECGKIVDVDFPDHLDKNIAHIEKTTRFTVLDHSLEFVGICGNCSS